TRVLEVIAGEGDDLRFVVDDEDGLHLALIVDAEAPPDITVSGGAWKGEGTARQAPGARFVGSAGGRVGSCAWRCQSSKVTCARVSQPDLPGPAPGLPES